MRSTAVQGIALRRTANWLFLLVWIVVSALAFLVIGVVFHYPGDLPDSDFVAFDLPFASMDLFTAVFSLSAAAFGFVLATVTGLLVGLLQWLILQRYLARAAWWIAVTAVGIGVTHALLDGAPRAEFTPLFMLVSGLLLGVLQWIVLRNHVGQAVWWIPVSIVGWYLAWLLGMLALNASGLLSLEWAPSIGAQQHGFFSLAFGVAYGALSGVFWLWLLREQKAAAV